MEVDDKLLVSQLQAHCSQPRVHRMTVGHGDEGREGERTVIALWHFSERNKELGSFGIPAGKRKKWLFCFNERIMNMC